MAMQQNKSLSTQIKSPQYMRVMWISLRSYQTRRRTHLRRCVGYPVGSISSKFRDYGNIKIREKRANTIGWTLIKEKTKL